MQRKLILKKTAAESRQFQKDVDLTDSNDAADAGDIANINQRVGIDGGSFMDDMPPRNTEGAELVLDKIKSEAHDAIYEKVYNGLFTKAANDARTALAGGGGAVILTPDQVMAIHTAVDAEAKKQADTYAQNLRNGLWGAYDEGYNGVAGRSPGFQAYYNEYLKAGDPKDVAEKKAEAKAMADGWAEMERRLVRAQTGGGTVANVEFSSNPTSARIDIAAPNNHLQDVSSGPITIPGLNNNPLAAVEWDATAADVVAIYNAVGKAGNTYLDVDHGLIGDPKNVVEGGAAYYVETFEDEAVSRQVPTKGNNLLTQENAQHAITAINSAIEAKDKIRAHLGALQNRFENTITNLNIQAENLQNAESRISDVDVATEMTEFVRQQILTQTAVAMLAQANSLPQMASQLIGG